MRRVIALAALASCVAVPAVARAQSKDDIARADALFNAAKALTDAGNYADACAKFAESKRLAPGLGVTLNDDVMRQHLAPGVGYFEPTPMWDTKQSFDDQLFS